jgi:hypothetical protein
MENANLLSAISISGRLFARRGNFLKKCKGLITYYALIGQLASPPHPSHRLGVKALDIELFLSRRPRK